MAIKFLVTQERFDELVSLDDWLNFDKLSNAEVGALMLNFVADGNGVLLSVEDARKVFKSVPKKDWPQVLADFIESVRLAFVNPTSGG